MRKPVISALRGVGLALGTACVVMLSFAQAEAGSALRVAQASPGIEPAPIKPLPGQLNLSEEQRQQIRESVESAGPVSQPVPRAFAPAVGMTSPPELKLEPLPEEARKIPGINEKHRYAMLESGLLMVVGDDRLVVAVIGPKSNSTTGSGQSQR